MATDIEKGEEAKRNAAKVQPEMVATEQSYLDRGLRAFDTAVQKQVENAYAKIKVKGDTTTLVEFKEIMKVLSDLENAHTALLTSIKTDPIAWAKNDSLLEQLQVLHAKYITLYEKTSKFPPEIQKILDQHVNNKVKLPRASDLFIMPIQRMPRHVLFARDYGVQLSNILKYSPPASSTEKQELEKKISDAKLANSRLDGVVKVINETQRNHETQKAITEFEKASPKASKAINVFNQNPNQKTFEVIIKSLMSKSFNSLTSEEQKAVLKNVKIPGTLTISSQIQKKLELPENAKLKSSLETIRMTSLAPTSIAPPAGPPPANAKRIQDLVADAAAKEKTPRETKANANKSGNVKPSFPKEPAPLPHKAFGPPKGPIPENADTVASILAKPKAGSQKAPPSSAPFYPSTPNPKSVDKLQQLRERANKEKPLTEGRKQAVQEIHKLKEKMDATQKSRPQSGTYTPGMKASAEGQARLVDTHKKPELKTDAGQKRPKPSGK